MRLALAHQKIPPELVVSQCIAQHTEYSPHGSFSEAQIKSGHFFLFSLSSPPMQWPIDTWSKIRACSRENLGRRSPFRLFLPSFPFESRTVKWRDFYFLISVVLTSHRPKIYGGFTAFRNLFSLPFNFHYLLLWSLIFRASWCFSFLTYYWYRMQ